LKIVGTNSFLKGKMGKAKLIYRCTNCGTAYGKWLGRCTTCGEWNSLVEEASGVESARSGIKPSPVVSKSRLLNLEEITGEPEYRLKFYDDELNRVLGGGVVPGSLILLAGEPGIGKSTLLLQNLLNFSFPSIFVSGEESPAQVKLRAHRIPGVGSSLRLFAETRLEDILAVVMAEKPDLVVIDSIQTVYADSVESTPGSIVQIRECTGAIMRLAKEEGIAFVLVGHINKEGSIAGPKILEHMVDVVLQFEGDRHHNYRMVRSLKNRFGGANELGIYEMDSNGLRPVSNPSELLVGQNAGGLSGSAICAALEGARPLLIETQALVSSAAYGTPQRNPNGIDLRRLHMLLAVLEKRCGFRLASHDVFVNLAGGLKIDDPALDLAVCMAILSSFHDITIPSSILFTGEVGLSGEIRPVQRMNDRIKEAERLGYETIFAPASNSVSNEKNERSGIKIKIVSRIEQVVEDLFG
jgi:DNA repair protein RadA/Sms